MPPLSTRTASQGDDSVTLCVHRDVIADRQARRRLVIFVVVVVFGAALLAAGHDVGAVLLILLGVGLAGATVGRWVVDGAGLPTFMDLLPAPADAVRS